MHPNALARRPRWAQYACISCRARLQCTSTVLPGVCRCTPASSSAARGAEPAMASYQRSTDVPADRRWLVACCLEEDLVVNRLLHPPDMPHTCTASLPTPNPSTPNNRRLNCSTPTQASPHLRSNRAVCQCQHIRTGRKFGRSEASVKMHTSPPA